MDNREQGSRTSTTARADPKKCCIPHHACTSVESNPVYTNRAFRQVPSTLQVITGDIWDSNKRPIKCRT